MGYAKKSPAYLVYHPTLHSVREYRCVKFLNHSDDCPEASPEGSHTPPRETLEVETEKTGPEEPVDAPATDTDQDNQSTEIPDNIRCSHREKRKPTYLDDYVQVANGEEVTVDYCYKAVMGIPRTYHEAMKCPDSKRWQGAMESEIQALRDHGTYELTPLPSNKKAVGGKWVYTLKESADGMTMHKARYVAKGYSQTEGVDYQEIFSPIATLASVRMTIQLAVQYDMQISQMDVKTAYLNAPIDCEVHVEQPEGYAQGKSSNLVWKLKKSLYGLKQSGRNWNVVLNQHLVSHAFKQSLVDPCLYTKKSVNTLLIALVWVDDILLAATSEKELSETKKLLMSSFQMKDLGQVSHFLGMQFIFNPDCIQIRICTS